MVGTGPQQRGAALVLVTSE
jgi:hypothetical protein